MQPPQPLLITLNFIKNPSNFTCCNPPSTIPLTNQVKVILVE